MHDWSDDKFDWAALNDAINYLHNYLEKYGRIGVNSKEKWGTARIYCTFAYNFHSLVYPGYAYCQFPKWLWHLDVYYGNKILRYTGALKLIQYWQKFIYVKAYANAVKKWPHIKQEITIAADQEHWLQEAKII